MGDDGVALSIDANSSLVMSVDSFIEGTHFTEPMGYQSVGWKSLVAALSDIIAMGVEPSFFSMSLGIPSYFTEKYFNDFLSGLSEASKAYGVQLIGGDVAKSPNFFVSQNVGGYGLKQKIKTLDGLKKGDVLFTNAQLGEAALGFEFFQREVHESEFAGAFLFPQIDLDFARWLRTLEYVTCLTDISDGIWSELSLLAKKNSCRIQAEEMSVNASFSQGCEKIGLNPEVVMLEGGEEYGLLWAIEPEKVPEFLKICQLRFKFRPQMVGQVMGAEIEGRERVSYPKKEVVKSLRPYRHF